MIHLTPTQLITQTGGTTVQTFVPQLTQTESDPFNAGGIVFFAVCAIIAVGALLLYLRNRRPATQA